MEACEPGTLLAFRLAEEMPVSDVYGSYDTQRQVWVGDTVSAYGTNTYSGTRCQTQSLTKTDCGYDSDVQYDYCSDYDFDSD